MIWQKPRTYPVRSSIASHSVFLENAGSYHIVLRIFDERSWKIRAIKPLAQAKPPRCPGVCPRCYLVRFFHHDAQPPVLTFDGFTALDEIRWRFSFGYGRALVSRCSCFLSMLYLYRSNLLDSATDPNRTPRSKLAARLLHRLLEKTEINYYNIHLWDNYLLWMYLMVVSNEARSNFLRKPDRPLEFYLLGNLSERSRY